MRSFWRLLLLCLMAVALPVQGYAAAGAVHCANMHERMQPASGHHPADASAPGHEHHPLAADHHDGDAGGHADAKCSACAACCAALALPSPLPVLPQLKVKSAPPRAIADAVAAFLTGGPERPPRTFLA